MNEGYRIWEIQDNQIPKEIDSGYMEQLEGTVGILEGLDLDNKTYAIRIGKSGLR